MQTPLTANATRERHPTRSAHDTGFIRASRALSHHERSQMPPAPPQSLKMLYSEPGEACGHVRASESTPPHRRKAPHQAHNRRAQRGHNSVHEAHTREGGSKQPPPSRQRRSRYLPVSYRTATRFACRCPGQASPGDTQPCNGTCQCRTPPPARQRMSRYPTDQDSASCICPRQSYR